MDWNRVEGNWKQVKGKVKEKWGQLTDDDLDKIAGPRDQLEGKIQERYGMAKDQVRRDVDDFVRHSAGDKRAVTRNPGPAKAGFFYRNRSRAVARARETEGAGLDLVGRRS